MMSPSSTLMDGLTVHCETLLGSSVHPIGNSYSLMFIKDVGLVGLQICRKGLLRSTLRVSPATENLTSIPLQVILMEGKSRSCRKIPELPFDIPWKGHDDDVQVLSVTKGNPSRQL